jgi:hypothetical protein
LKLAVEVVDPDSGGSDLTNAGLPDPVVSA